MKPCFICIGTFIILLTATTTALPTALLSLRSVRAGKVSTTAVTVFILRLPGMIKEYLFVVTVEK